MSELTDEIKRIAKIAGCHPDAQTLLAAAIKSAIPPRERPILMKGEMVRATLDDIKTNTRRVIKIPEGAHITFEDLSEKAQYYVNCGWCPFGRPGDRLWVRETWAYSESEVVMSASDERPVGSKLGIVAYRATTGDPCPVAKKWKPSIFMPRAACRLTLEIVSIRVQRLQEISEEDSKREGVRSVWSDDQGETPGRYLYFTDASKEENGHATAKLAFRELWDSINAKREGGKYAWANSPRVWAIEFKKL